MTIRSFPASLPAPETFKWHLQPNSQTYTSPLNGATQTAEQPGAMWTAQAAWSVLTPAQWRLFEAFIRSCRGASGRFYYGPVHANAPIEIITGTPTVYGGTQVGASIVTAGWGAGGPVLQPGDYFHFDTSFGRELKQVVIPDEGSAPTVADGSGHATLYFEPPIRNSPDNGASLVFQNPTCVMRLLSDTEGQGSYESGLNGANGFQMIEAFYPVVGS